MHAAQQAPHWLDDYAGKRFEWQKTRIDGKTTYYRPLGLVELTFDADGRYNEGRADMNALLELEVKCELTLEELRQRISLAWTCLRCQHSLLQARAVAVSRRQNKHSATEEDTCFAVDAWELAGLAIADAMQHIVFLQDHYTSVEPMDFWLHTQNTGRVIDPSKALAKLFVFPLEASGSTGESTLIPDRIKTHVEDMVGSAWDSALYGRSSVTLCMWDYTLT